MSKFQLTYDIIKTTGLLYEVALQGPKKLGKAMEMFANLEFSYTRGDSTGLGLPDGYVSVISASKDSPSKMANDFLEYVYKGAPIPEWLPVPVQ